MVRVYTTECCPGCGAVKGYLEQHGIEYEELDGPTHGEEIMKGAGRWGMPAVKVDQVWIIGASLRRLSEVLGHSSPTTP